MPQAGQSHPAGVRKQENWSCLPKAQCLPLCSLTMLLLGFKTVHKNSSVNSSYDGSTGAFKQSTFKALPGLVEVLSFLCQTS